MQCNRCDRQRQAGWILDAHNMHQGGCNVNVRPQDGLLLGDGQEVYAQALWREQALHEACTRSRQNVIAMYTPWATPVWIWVSGLLTDTSIKMSSARCQKHRASMSQNKQRSPSAVTLVWRSRKGKAIT